MRKSLIFLIVLIILIAGIWLGRESWVAVQVREGIAADDRLAAARVTPLRELTRIGIHVEGLEVTDEDMSISVPAVDLWSSPLSLTEIQTDLPDRIDFVRLGDPIALGMKGAHAYLRSSPLTGGAVAKAGLHAREITVNDVPAVERLSTEAILTGLGARAPMEASAAYDVAVNVTGAKPAALAELGIKAAAENTPALSAEGVVKVFLTGAPGRGGWETPLPVLVGVASDGMDIFVGELTARVAGLLTEDENGFAQGRIYLDTSDAQELLQTAVDAGILPQMAATFGAGLLAGVANLVAEEAPDANAPPLPPKGTIRLVVDLKEGKILMAGQTLGTAPRFYQLPPQ